MYKFISLKPSKDGTHKYEATIYNETTKRNNTVKFGSASNKDYTIYYKDDKEKAEIMKKAYIARHGAEKAGENWGKSGINTAGWWSRWILWAEPTVEKSLAKVKKTYFS